MGLQSPRLQFPLSEHDDMAALLKTMKGKAVVSVNDIHP